MITWRNIRTMQHSTTQHYTSQRTSAQHITAPHIRTTQHITTPHNTTQQMKAKAKKNKPKRHSKAQHRKPENPKKKRKGRQRRREHSTHPALQREVQAVGGRPAGDGAKGRMRVVESSTQRGENVRPVLKQRAAGVPHGNDAQQQHTRLEKRPIGFRQQTPRDR